MSIGERIKIARKKAGLTQNQLAEALNLSAITIRQYESGKRKPQIEQIARIANVLGVKWYELYSDDEDEQMKLVAGFVWDATKEALNLFRENPFEDEFIEMFKSDVMQKLGKKGVEIQQKKLKEANEEKGLPFFELDQVTFDAFVRHYISNLLMAHEIYPRDKNALLELGFTAGDAYAMMDLDDNGSDEYADFVDGVAERLDEMQNESEKAKKE